MRFVQLKAGSERRLAMVEEPKLRLLRDFNSLYTLAQAAIITGDKLTALAGHYLSEDALDYEQIYEGVADWKLLSPIDHPGEPARCLVSGTGLTHLGSARDRQSMHLAKEQDLTDSMKMFQWGVEGGRPARGEIGSAPEWFYKGNGSMVRAHNEPLLVPAYAADGGEEAEIASAYFIGRNGQPYRIGMVQGNEFSDHVFEKSNYLNLAGSKLRTCSLGPELVIDPDFHLVPGKVSIARDGRDFWSQPIASGEEEMCHSLRNLEHHHFKFELHRRPGDVHIHFLGAHSLSFGQGLKLQSGDVMSIQFESFGRPLRNPVLIPREKNTPVEVIPLA
jgi:hypothetical protein